MVDDAQPGIGHNEPPPFADDPLFARTDELVRNCNRWIAERAEIADQEQANAAQLFIDQLLTARDDLDAQQKTEREPIDLMLTALRIKYRDPLALIDLALASMRAKAAVWLQKRKQRLAEEQAARVREATTLRSFADQLADEARQTDATIHEQRAAQEAERAAQAAEKAAGRKPPRAQIKGDYAAKAMSLKTYWHARVVDIPKALASYADNERVQGAALNAALKEAEALAKKTKRADAAPPGFQFFSDERAT